MLRGWTRWLEPWFAAYALVGLLVSGIVPILVPLTVEHAGAFAVGLVVAAFYGGTLFAPVFGSVADKTGTQRLTFLASFPTMAVAAVLFSQVHATALWFLCALLAGAAAGAAQTTASVFIVEGHPQSEWSERIGWSRSAFGTGQVVGLAVSAIFTHRLDLGWIATGSLVLVGTVVGRIHLPHVGKVTAAAPSQGAEPSAPQHNRLVDALRSPFGTLLVSWLLAMVGLMTFYNVVPLVMRDAFGVSPQATSVLFLIGAGIGVVMYPLTGRIAQARNAPFVLAIGYLTTLIAFVAMTVTSLTHPSWKAAVGALCLIAIATAYPFQYVGANLLAAELSRGGEGSAMGLFNSAVAAGAIVGAIAPSFLADAFGYDSLPPLAAGAVLLAVLVGIPLLRRPARQDVES